MLPRWTVTRTQEKQGSDVARLPPFYPRGAYTYSQKDISFPSTPKSLCPRAGKTLEVGRESEALLVSKQFNTLSGEVPGTSCWKEGSRVLGNVQSVRPIHEHKTGRHGTSSTLPRRAVEQELEEGFQEGKSQWLSSRTPQTAELGQVSRPGDSPEPDLWVTF